MNPRTIPYVALAAWLAAAPLPASAQGAVPDLSGTWNSSTATPIQRPRDMADKPFFTRAEADEWVRQFAARTAEPAPDAPRRGTGTFNTVYREYGTDVVKTLRTSIIIEPSNGRVPPLTPEAEEARRRHLAGQRALENPEELSLQDRCVQFSTSGPPLLPYSYNSNYQIIQTSDHVVVHTEMIHDARIIYLDGRAHPPEQIRLMGGHSVGRWEADTLVVETRNFDDTRGFYGGAGGMYAWTRDVRMTERFSYYDDDTLLYRFEVEDPAAFTAPWAGELTMSRATGNIYEYACHEGNYSMSGMLSGARYSERNPG